VSLWLKPLVIKPFADRREASATDIWLEVQQQNAKRPTQQDPSGRPDGKRGMTPDRNTWEGTDYQ
jgi:hypothetical protein